MAITRKPQKSTQSAAGVNIDALIAKGGGVAQTSDEGEPQKKLTSFTLRVPQDILKKLDGHREKQPYKVPRQQWILEAIIQRLESGPDNRSIEDD